MEAAEFARSLPAVMERLPALLEEMESWLAEIGVPPNDMARLMVAFDEILSNIVKHGGETLELQLARGDGNLIAIIADDGPPFDPLARPAPDVDLDIDDRRIGGLGIHLVREMMDELAYAYENGWNRLKFTKTFERSGGR